MLTINHTVFIQILNFLILLILLNIIAYRPIRGILNRRREEMSSRQGLAEGWNKKADEFSDELKTSISATKKEGLRQKENIKNEGVESERLILDDAFSSVEENMIRARSEIQVRLAEARETLRNDLDTLSRDLAKKILGRNI
jgi:F-type H+-transporting ATPase subunit b